MIMALIVLFSGFPLEKAIVTLSGVTDVSELSEEDFERYSFLAAHPLKINSSPRSVLLASGLLSAYQAESLLEYRQKHGDILSLTELQAVGGFAGETAHALSPFLDLSPGTGRGEGKLRLEGIEAVTAGGMKINDGKITGQWKARTDFEVCGSNFGFGGAAGAKSPWSERIPGIGESGWNVHANAGKWLTEIVAGCFNARFGQGLLMWSGSVFNSYGSPASLMKKPYGIVPYKGWSPSYALKGAAARMDFGRFSVMPFVSFGGTVEYGGNISWNHRNGEISANVLVSKEMQGYSVDFQHTVRGTVLYGEACVTKAAATAGKLSSSTVTASEALSPSALLGATIPAGQFDMGFRALWTGKEHNATSALSYMSQNRKHSVSLGASASYKKEKRSMTIKAQGQYNASLSESLGLLTKATVSMGGTNRYTLREEVSWSDGAFSAGARADAAYCMGTAVMFCADCGYKNPSGSTVWTINAQAGAFRADNWDDRIYVYMRDLPGNFSVPALYGRGWWANAYAKVTAVRRLDICLRVMYMAYPWARDGDTHVKPSLNAGLQLSWKL